MSVYKNGAVNALHRHGEPIQSAYDGDKQYFSSFVPAGTVLVTVNTAIESGGRQNTVRGPITIPHIDKVKNGIKINLAGIVYGVNDGSGTSIVSNSYDGVATNITNPVVIPVSEFGNKIHIADSASGVSSMPNYVQIVEGKAVFWGDLGGKTANSTEVWYTYNYNNLYELKFLRIGTITAY